MCVTIAVVSCVGDPCGGEKRKERAEENRGTRRNPNLYRLALQ